MIYLSLILSFYKLNRYGSNIALVHDCSRVNESYRKFLKLCNLKPIFYLNIFTGIPVNIQNTVDSRYLDLGYLE